ncbi:MAG: hypothetical protein ISS15_03415 [Alphaproteobacteria bacterium]|nr:hypothetical protein [Alphaproteobacteria bacterium]MBL6939169.1 hypothetical protein [Alphaproteobacteria bacterium]MBL7096685.1 hypothetical protein [Alphaproteobacteria bacterium]
MKSAVSFETKGSQPAEAASREPTHPAHPGELIYAGVNFKTKPRETAEPKSHFDMRREPAFRIHRNLLSCGTDFGDTRHNCACAAFLAAIMTIGGAFEGLLALVEHRTVRHWRTPRQGVVQGSLALPALPFRRGIRETAASQYSVPRAASDR